MLSAHKEDEGAQSVAVPPNTTLSAAGNVVGAVERLRYKLDSVTIAEIEETQKELATLATRLRQLQHALENVSRVREQVLSVERGKSEGVITSVDDLLIAAPPPSQLQALANLRKLIVLPRPVKGAGESRETGQSVSKHKRSQDHAASERAAAVINRETTPPRAASADIPVSAPETPPPSSSGTAHATGLDRAAPVTNRDPERRPPTREQPRTASPAKTVSVSERQRNHGAERSQQDTAEESRFEFDQRLLNDLIKDYGEFIIPVSKQAAEPSPAAGEPESAPGPAEPEFPLVENVAPPKPAPAAAKDVDLDQRLKKLIKDYGEYDLYSDHSSKKYRAGIIAVCALLVVIIAAVYFYWRSSATSPAPSSQPIQSNLEVRGGAPARSDSSARTGFNAEQSDFRKSGNSPYATKNPITVEKGGN